MPMPEMKTVQSTKVFQLGYDEAAKALYVRFTPSKKHPAGRVAVYHGVPPETADAFANAPSIGQAFDISIKDVFSFTYL
jgi:hypothetical protein